MNLEQARAVQATGRAVNDAAQRLHHAVGDDATESAAVEYVAARAAHNRAVADAEDPENGDRTVPEAEQREGFGGVA